MPELPEVQTIVSGLKPLILGREIKSVEILEPKSFIVENALITEVISEQKICSLWRRAKVLIIDFDSGYSVLIHLKMTGQIVFAGKNAERFAGGHPSESAKQTTDLPDNTTRVIFSFTDGSKMYFNDLRKFGWIKISKTSDVLNDEFLVKVGPEPFDEIMFTPEYLWKKCKNRITPIKALLLDQSIVAGIGNIYADEALHLAKIHPAIKASMLSRSEILVLYNSIQTVLQEGIKRGGTSFSDFVNANGTKGDYLQHARVFRRENLPCKECLANIIKIKVAGRGTHYCPVCQKTTRDKKS